VLIDVALSGIGDECRDSSRRNGNAEISWLRPAQRVRICVLARYWELSSTCLLRRKRVGPTADALGQGCGGKTHQRSRVIYGVKEGSKLRLVSSGHH